MLGLLLQLQPFGSGLASGFVSQMLRSFHFVQRVLLRKIKPCGGFVHFRSVGPSLGCDKLA